MPLLKNVQCILSQQEGMVLKQGSVNCSQLPLHPQSPVGLPILWGTVSKYTVSEQGLYLSELIAFWQFTLEANILTIFSIKHTSNSLIYLSFSHIFRPLYSQLLVPHLLCWGTG